MAAPSLHLRSRLALRLRSRLAIAIAIIGTVALASACASVSTMPDQIANNPDRPPSGADVDCLTGESYDACAVRLGIYLYANENEQSCANGLTEADCQERFRVIMERRNTPERNSAVAPWLFDEFAEMGVSATAEHAACIEERGIDPLAAAPSISTAAEQATLSVGLLVCAADDLAAGVQFTSALPVGFTPDDIACVTAQRFKALGDFTPEEAIEVVQNPGTDGVLRDAVVARATAACGLSAEDVDSLFVYTR